MKLTAKALMWLRRLEDGPVFQSSRHYPGWATEEQLWKAGLIDCIGRSIYITDAGRAALKEANNEHG